MCITKCSIEQTIDWTAATIGLCSTSIAEYLAATY